MTTHNEMETMNKFTHYARTHVFAAVAAISAAFVAQLIKRGCSK